MRQTHTQTETHTHRDTQNVCLKALFYTNLSSLSLPLSVSLSLSMTQALSNRSLNSLSLSLSLSLKFCFSLRSFLCHGAKRTARLAMNREHLCSCESCVWVFEVCLRDFCWTWWNDLLCTWLIRGTSSYDVSEGVLSRENKVLLSRDRETYPVITGKQRKWTPYLGKTKFRYHEISKKLSPYLRKTGEINLLSRENGANHRRAHRNPPP